MKLFSDSARLVNFVKFSNIGGKESERLFELIDKNCNLLNIPSEEGIKPLSRLKCKPRLERDVKFPIEEGIEPVSQL